MKKRIRKKDLMNKLEKVLSENEFLSNRLERIEIDSRYMVSNFDKLYHIRNNVTLKIEDLDLMKTIWNKIGNEIIKEIRTEIEEKIKKEISRQYEIPNEFMQMMSSYVAFDTRVRPPAPYKEEVLHIVKHFQSLIDKNPRLAHIFMKIDNLWG